MCVASRVATGLVSSSDSILVGSYRSQFPDGPANVRRSRSKKAVPFRDYFRQISGPLDVDKLDYIQRDCYMAGVPMPVDVDRLMEKIQCNPPQFSPS